MSPSSSFVFPCLPANNCIRRLNALTREHTLKILFRLALDETVMNDGAVCAEARRAIPALFGQSRSSALPEANVCLPITLLLSW